MSKKTIHFVSLGCPKNRVDTEVMLGVGDQAGYELVAEAERAEVIVVNTCGFIGPAKEESIETIFDMARLKEKGRCQKLVVAGCLSQRYPGQLAEEMPEVDHFLGSSDMLKLGQVLRSSAHHPAERMLVGNPADYSFRVSDPRLPSMALHSAYLKIAEGCSRRCSFCIIPSMRGKQRSRPPEDVQAELLKLIDRGAREINLVSQDTVSYGRDLRTEGVHLTALVERLAETPGLHWLRLFYLYPEKLDEGLLELLAQHPKVLPYVDMPLQHASDAMLMRMRRGHGGERQRKVVARLREAVPGLTLRSAFIIGHPGETDADFEELCEFVRWAEFDRLGLFRYSHEEGTHAGSMEALVDEALIEQRHATLMEIQRPISRRKQEAMIGQDIEVLVEGVSDESEFLLDGRHRGQAPEIDGKVVLANGEANPGELRRARVTHASDYDLVADLLEADGPGSAGQRRSPDGKIRLRTIH